MTGRCIPLTLALSPEGRGKGVAPVALAAQLTNRSPSLRNAWRRGLFPLPSGERARVRGRMQQTDLSKSRARAMRKAMTTAEATLWFALRDRRLMGLKFRRQVPLGPWIAHFYCAAHRLVVEADGGGHGGPQDLLCDRWLAERGFRVIRLWNSDILGNLSGCQERIAREVSP